MSNSSAPFSNALQFLFRSNAGLFSDAAGTTPQSTNGGTVLRWKDQSDNGNDLVQMNVGAGATLQLNQVNSLPSIRFNGTSSFFYLSNVLVPASRTMYFVLKAPAPVSGVQDLIAGNQGSLEYRIDTSTGALKQRLVNAGTADIGFATNTFAANTWTQINASWDFTTGTFRQASAANGTASGALAINPVRYVGCQTANAIFFSGDMAAILMYAGVHSTAQRQAVEKWLNGIYGV